MEGKTWAESANKFFTIKKDGRKIKRVIKLLSGVTIWGQPEAITKEMLNPLVEAHGPVHGNLKVAPYTVSLKENKPKQALLQVLLLALLTRNNVLTKLFLINYI